jgi:hypothetical protein
VPLDAERRWQGKRGLQPVEVDLSIDAAMSRLTLPIGVGVVLPDETLLTASRRRSQRVHGRRDHDEDREGRVQELWAYAFSKTMPSAASASRLGVSTMSLP